MGTAIPRTYNNGHVENIYQHSLASRGWQRDDSFT